MNVLSISFLFQKQRSGKGTLTVTMLESIVIQLQIRKEIRPTTNGNDKNLQLMI